MYYFFAFVLLIITNVSFAQDNNKKEGFVANYASFIMYHRFGENKYPSTNIKKEQFLEHINELLKPKYNVIKIEQALNAINNKNLVKEISLKYGSQSTTVSLDVKKVNEKPSELINELSKKIGEKEVVLVTGHRRENHGDGFDRICKALKKIAQHDINRLIIYPVHLNPKVQEPVNRILSGINNVILINPLAYQDFIWLMNRSKIIITDSGGVQEEAPSLGKPVLVMRDTTEGPEAVEVGTVLLVGTNENLIVSKALDLLNNKDNFLKMSQLHNPYGDGLASERIVKFIKNL